MDLSDYEKQRLETLEANQKKLNSLLGIDDRLIACRERQSISAEELKRRHEMKEKRIRNALRRRRISPRIRAKALKRPLAPFPHLVSSLRARKLENDHKTLLQKSVCKPTQRVTAAQKAMAALTASQRATLAGDSSWIEEMHTYFEGTISMQNLRGVMKVNRSQSNHCKRTASRISAPHAPTPPHRFHRKHDLPPSRRWSSNLRRAQGFSVTHSMLVFSAKAVQSTCRLTWLHCVSKVRGRTKNRTLECVPRLRLICSITQ